jgi:hypothetical protein
MTTLFVICGVAGGAFLLCQLTLTLVGLGGGELHDGGSLDVHDGDFAGHGDALDVHTELAGHGGGNDLHTGAAGHEHGATHEETQTHERAVVQPVAHHDASWLFRAISLRTVVAALTFFGLTGLAAQSAQASTSTTLACAISAGLIALYSVYWLMHSLYGLRSEGTARIERALGKRASVYLRIPGHNAGCGKIQVNLQNRTMEYLAATAGEGIATGATVAIVEIIDACTVRVTPVCETERTEHVDQPSACPN